MPRIWQIHRPPVIGAYAPVKIKMSGDGSERFFPCSKSGGGRKSVVFFPAAGNRNGSDVNNVGNNGNYWSSSLNEKNENNARINSIMNWMFMVLDRCTSEHKKIIENNERIIDEFISWKMKTKESLKAKETIKDNCYEIISELISKIQVPEPPKQADTETTTL